MRDLTVEPRTEPDRRVLSDLSGSIAVVSGRAAVMVGECESRIMDWYRSQGIAQGAFVLLFLLCGSQWSQV